MRFLVDECTGPLVVQWLRSLGYDVFSVYDEARGIPDEKVIRRAFTEDRVLITNDKDFGEMVYRKHYPHHGIILLRLENERAKVKIQVLERLLTNYSESIKNRFVVVTEHYTRFSSEKM